MWVTEIADWRICFNRGMDRMHNPRTQKAIGVCMLSEYAQKGMLPGLSVDWSPDHLWSRDSDWWVQFLRYGTDGVRFEWVSLYSFYSTSCAVYSLRGFASSPVFSVTGHVMTCYVSWSDSQKGSSWLKLKTWQHAEVNQTFYWLEFWLTGIYFLFFNDR